MHAGWFLDRLRERGHTPALVCGDRELDYAALCATIDACRRRLAELGTPRVVAFASDDWPTAPALLLALAADGHVAVPCSDRMLAHPDAPFAVANVQALVRREGDTLQLERREVAIAHPLLRGLADVGRPGLVVFSSGSTGESKAVLHDLARLLERYRQPRRAWRALTFLRLDHFGGLNTLLQIFASGGTAIAVDTRSPDEIGGVIERHHVELLPATPTFLNLMLMADVPRRYDLSSLQRVTYGTEVMPEATLARLQAALPHARLQQTYGLSELGVLQSKSADPGSLWVEIGGDGFETRIVDGRLWIRSRFAMLGYLNAPAPFDGDGWFDTGDRVEVAGDRVRILGRDSDLINVGGEKVHPAEIEAVLLSMPNVRDATVFAHKSPVTGNVVAARLVLHEPEEPAALRQRVRELCGARLARYKVPMMIEIAPEPAVGERYKKLRPRAS